MKKSNYLPSDEMGRQLWLQNFAGKLATYATTLNISAADIASTQADAAYFTYVLDMVNRYKENTKQRVAYKTLLMNGDTTNAPLGGIPANPVLATAPAAVPSGIFKRSALLVQRIKAQTNYTEAIGKELGIIGAESTLDLNSMKPVIQIVMQAHRPNIKWVKQGMSGIKIYVDRTGTGYTFLATDTEPDYLDTAPLPAVGTSAIWKYRAIYFYHDEEVGNYSDEVSVSVASFV